MIDAAEAARRLDASGRAIAALVETVGPEEALWRPAPDAWSVVEVVNHLADEESDDFRHRLEATLERPEAEWPPIDPEGWAVERGYRDRDLRESLGRFLDERARSLAWLQGLEAPEWRRGHARPDAGVIRAGDLLASWLAHDLLHVRQITRLRYRWLEREARPFDPAYAGPF